MTCELREKIRELHRPRWFGEDSNEVWLVCEGCDEGGHAECPASWPCTTAMAVYTTDEIEALKPKVPECTEDHFGYNGTPYRPAAIFIRLKGMLFASRHNCIHVTPAPADDKLPYDTTVTGGNT